MFQTVFLTKCYEHGSMDVKFAQVGMAVEKINKINLGKGLKSLEVPSEFHLHKKMLHFTCQFQNFAYCIPTPLNPPHRQELQSWKVSNLNHVNSPWNQLTMKRGENIRRWAY